MSAPKTSKMVEFAHLLLVTSLPRPDLDVEAKLKVDRKRYEEMCADAGKEPDEEVWECLRQATINPPRWSRFIG